MYVIALLLPAAEDQREAEHDHDHGRDAPDGDDVLDHDLSPPHPKRRAVTVRPGQEGDRSPPAASVQVLLLVVRRYPAEDLLPALHVPGPVDPLAAVVPLVHLRLLC